MTVTLHEQMIIIMQESEEITYNSNTIENTSSPVLLT